MDNSHPDWITDFMDVGACGYMKIMERIIEIT